MSLRKWLREEWVNIALPKKNGKWQKCGTGTSEKYAVCRPLSVANKMTAAQIKSSVRRKRKDPSKNIKHHITASGKTRKSLR